MMGAAATAEEADMDEHRRIVVRVADWLADGWDWDAIGAALGLSGDEAAERYGREAEAYHETEAQRLDGGP